jgi:hypothetical protein
MRKLTLALLLVSAFAALTTTAPPIYARDGQGSCGSMMGHGMMGDDHAKTNGGMMGMKDMMNMMRQMSEMIDHCNNMMGNDRPSDQPQR